MILDFKLSDHEKVCSNLYYMKNNFLFDNDSCDELYDNIEVSLLHAETGKNLNEETCTNEFNKMVWPDEEVRRMTMEENGQFSDTSGDNVERNYRRIVSWMEQVEINHSDDGKQMAREEGEEHDEASENELSRGCS